MATGYIKFGMDAHEFYCVTSAKKYFRYTEWLQIMWAIT